MSTININGVNITGRNITVKNNRVIIDGKDVTPDSKQINISVQGDVGDIKVDMCEKIIVTGNASQVSTTSGDIEVGGSVGGSAKTISGDINCGNIGGDASTMSGDITKK